MQQVAIRALIRSVTKGAYRMYAILILGGLVSGCAFSNVDVSLPTGSTSGYSGGQGRSLIIPAFVDQRQIKNRIGMQKNGFGMDTANALPDQSVETWLTTRLGTELQSSGFQIVSEGTNPKAAKVQGYLLKLFIEPVQQWTTVDLETDLSVRLRVTRPDGLEAERQYFVKGAGQGLMSLGGAYSASLNNATDVLLKRVVADVINLLNKFPDS
jgi:hypothetical protein